MATAAPHPATPDAPPAWRGWYVVFVLSIASIVSFIDRQIINLLVDPIKLDLGISDFQISLLQGFAFALFYAFLAIPLALGRRRSDRSYGIVVGLIILVVYHQVLDFLENMAESQVIDPAIALWTPFLVYVLGSVLLFRRVSKRVPGALWIDPLAAITSVAGVLVPRLATRKKESG